MLRDAPGAVGFACIVAAAARGTAAAAAARGSGRWRGSGHVSYGVYLWHVPLLLFLRAHGRCH